MNKLINILHPIYQSTRTSVEATRIVNPCNLKTKYMNTQSTIDKMRQLRLNGMSDLYQRAIKESLFTNSSNDEFIALIIESM